MLIPPDMLTYLGYGVVGFLMVIGLTMKLVPSVTNTKSQVCPIHNYVMDSVEEIKSDIKIMDVKMDNKMNDIYSKVTDLALALEHIKGRLE
jgi:hypothetical protein